MNHPSCLEFDNEEGEERSKEEISHLQEVAGPDICRVIAQKGHPLLSSGLVCANLPHVLLNGPLAHVNVQFQKFATNPFSAQSRLFLAISLINEIVSAASFACVDFGFDLCFQKRRKP